MPSLQELLEKDFGVTEKTASEQSTSSVDDEEINKLAQLIGLSAGELKTAEEEETEEEENKKAKTSEKEEDAGEKTAGLESLYGNLFPEDASFESEKTAEETKLAAYQEHVGELAYDEFANRLDQRIEKLAVDLMTGEIKVSAEGLGTDSQPAQALPNNKPANAGASINTAPVVTDEVKAKNDEKTVGHFAQKVAALKAKFGHQLTKAAEAHLNMIGECYTYGHDKLAQDTADAYDAQIAEAIKLAEEAEKMEKETEEDDEETKKASVELGSFIERGFFDSLQKLGSARHGDPLFYFYPFIEEKVAGSAALSGVDKFVKVLSDYAGKAKNVMTSSPKVLSDYAGKAKNVMTSSPKVLSDYAGKAKKVMTSSPTAELGRAVSKGKTFGERAKHLGLAGAAASPYVALGAAARGSKD